MFHSVAAESGEVPSKGEHAHPRVVGWIGATALGMGGSNQSPFLLAALIAAQGSAAVPLLVPISIAVNRQS